MGGIAALVIIGLALFFFRRRRARQRGGHKAADHHHPPPTDLKDMQQGGTYAPVEARDVGAGDAEARELDASQLVELPAATYGQHELPGSMPRQNYNLSNR